jgi:hypothetical protein
MPCAVYTAQLMLVPRSLLSVALPCHATQVIEDYGHLEVMLPDEYVVECYSEYHVQVRVLAQGVYVASSSSLERPEPVPWHTSPAATSASDEASCHQPLPCWDSRTQPSQQESR